MWLVDLVCAGADNLVELRAQHRMHEHTSPPPPGASCAGADGGSRRRRAGRPSRAQQLAVGRVRDFEASVGNPELPWRTGIAGLRPAGQRVAPSEVTSCLRDGPLQRGRGRPRHRCPPAAGRNAPVAVLRSRDLGQRGELRPRARHGPSGPSAARISPAEQQARPPEAAPRSGASAAKPGRSPLGLVGDLAGVDVVVGGDHGPFAQDGATGDLGSRPYHRTGAHD